MAPTHAYLPPHRTLPRLPRRTHRGGGSDNELNIRPAFQNCLAAYCNDHRERLTLVPELPGPGGIPDGTVKDSLRMARGYWEAKRIVHNDRDTHEWYMMGLAAIHSSPEDEDWLAAWSET